MLALPRTPYPAALELMRDLAAAKAREPLDDLLILVEHEPVFTLGVRAAERDILVPPELLAREGISLCRVERGGLVTYHGPGQLVAYPILDLRARGLGPRELVAGLEEALLAFLAEFGVTGRIHPDHPGAWVGEKKIASIGVAVRRGISFHGLALNLDPNLGHFGLINPCGLTSQVMTSLAQLTGGAPPVAEAGRRFLAHFVRRFGYRPRDIAPAEARAIAVRAGEGAAGAAGEA